MTFRDGIEAAAKEVEALVKHHGWGYLSPVTITKAIRSIPIPPAGTDDTERAERIVLKAKPFFNGTVDDDSQSRLALITDITTALAAARADERAKGDKFVEFVRVWLTRPKVSLEERASVILNHPFARGDHLKDAGSGT